ncbi:MAG: peptide ABC transporter substrate-binding protein [Candidatus Moranbacteria bacterium]|nr:peptide ABC transporter substrate-binding protein [Candidatus Moranbacteria bacterium]
MLNKLSEYLPKREKQLEPPKSDETSKIPPAVKTGWRMPNWEQLIFLIKALSEKEKKILLGTLFLVCFLFAGWGLTIYLKGTNKNPALGGSYSEAVQGQPLYLNPIVSHGNPVDNDLSSLIFSSLFRYNNEGKLEQDLVDKWERSSDGLTYTITLRSNVKWHDGQNLSAEDVIFTINLIRNPAYGSVFRNNLEGIGIEKTDDQNIVFTLKKAYTPFLHNLTFGILPKHLWEKVTSDKFLLTELNRKPVGSGMYSFFKLEKDRDGRITAVTLRANNYYYRASPHLRELVFHFYPQWEDMVNAYSNKEVQGISYVDTAKIQRLGQESGLTVYEIPTTRVYGIFFNQQKSPVLADKTTREGLRYGTNKEELLKKALNGKGIIINTPLLPSTLGFGPEINLYEFNEEKAKDAFRASGWNMLNEKERKKVSSMEGMEKIFYSTKLKKFLTFTLTVPDYPELVATANTLKEQWEKVGVMISLDIVTTSETLQDKISTRNYEALLFGEVLQADTDPTPFWHSSSKQSPGLNLSLFDNKDADALLDSARQEVNEEKRAELYHSFGSIINREVPAILLFSPFYLYGISSDYQGISAKMLYNPSDRLNDIGQRYLFTSRIRR